MHETTEMCMETGSEAGHAELYLISASDSGSEIHKSLISKV